MGTISQVGHAVCFLPSTWSNVRVPEEYEFPPCPTMTVLDFTFLSQKILLLFDAGRVTNGCLTQVFIVS